MGISKIDELLYSLSKDDLIIMLKDLIEDYEGLEEKILFRYLKLKEKDEIKKNKKYLSDIIKRHGIKRRYINLREVANFTNEVSEVLYNSREYYNEMNKPLVPVETTLLVVSKMIDAINYVDDSNGDIGEVIQNALQLLEEVCSECGEFTPKEKKTIFDRIFKEIDNPRYDGWSDWKLDILNNCVFFCDDRKLREILLNKLNKLIESYEDDWSGNYKAEKTLGIKLLIIGEYGTKEEEEEFIEKNIKYSGFREVLINNCIENNNYERVLELAEDGELQDKSYRGLVNKWNKYKYIAYKELKIHDKQKNLARELFVNGDMEYYKELKEIHKNEWDDFYLELKNQFKETGRDPYNVYSEMLIKENDLKGLLELISKDVRLIELYDSLLMEDYKENVNELYAFLIEKTSEIASDRGQYRKVCKTIKRYKELFGEVATYKIVKYLENKYKKRPAFIDELGKV